MPPLSAYLLPLGLLGFTCFTKVSVRDVKCLTVYGIGWGRDTVKNDGIKRGCNATSLDGRDKKKPAVSLDTRALEHLWTSLDNWLVPGAGIEPARCHHRGILSPVRLPIPPSRQRKTAIMNDFESESKPPYSIFLSLPGCSANRYHRRLSSTVLHCRALFRIIIACRKFAKFHLPSHPACHISNALIRWPECCWPLASVWVLLLCPPQPWHPIRFSLTL